MIVSDQFDDVYFSRDDGLAETRYVFLQGCGLPDAWAGRDYFCIGELGFGTGLNVLAAWKLFEETAGSKTRLDIVSVEKYPLSPARIREALGEWRDDLGGYLDRLLDVYPMRTAGFHRINLSERVTLTLVFDDVRVALDGIVGQVDAWFLDGFAPAKNPDMWGADVLAQVARLSHKGTTLATFTAAGVVRSGLADVGFAVRKVKGFKYKRDMVVGTFEGDVAPPVRSQIACVAVMGSGLAGASVAWHLRRAGVDVQVFEAGAEIASGASGNRLGLVSPKLTVFRAPETDFYVSAYDYALHVMRGLRGVEFNACGSLLLELDADKTRRFNGYLANLGWDGAHMMRVDAQGASDIAGVRVDVGALWLPDGANVCPKALCRALLDGIDVVYGVRTPPDGFDAVVYATGDYDALGLDLVRVRGQVTRLRAVDVSAGLRVNLGYGGYCAPAVDGVHMCGATFMPGGQACEVLETDHARNIAQLQAAMPVFADVDWRVDGGWVGFRAATRDRFPVVGRHDKGWVSTAHGSHGLVTGLMSGAMIVAQMLGGVSPVSGASAYALGVDRGALKL